MCFLLSLVASECTPWRWKKENQPKPAYPLSPDVTVPQRKNTSVEQFCEHCYYRCSCIVLFRPKELLINSTGKGACGLSHRWSCAVNKLMSWQTGRFSCLDHRIHFLLNVSNTFNQVLCEDDCCCEKNQSKQVMMQTHSHILPTHPKGHSYSFPSSET